MPKASKWSVVKRFPLTQVVHKAISKTVPTKRKQLRSDIVSPSLYDDIFQRLSPYLLRKAPVDILDLWPGSGCWSAKVNEYLRPRRHVLIEPDLPAYQPLLGPLTANNPSMELVSFDIYAQHNWSEIFKKHLPEQKAPTGEDLGILPKNDTLLVLAQPPDTISSKSHYTPGRWWSAAMKSCMQKTDLHMYGSVRILALLPPLELESVLPRGCFYRKRSAILTECVAMHNLEIARQYNPESWTNTKMWHMIRANSDRVAERAAAQNILTPADREPVPLQLAPLSAKPIRTDHPYQYRVRTEWHETTLKRIDQAKAFDENDRSPKALAARRASNVANSSLNRDNRYSWAREHVAKKQLHIDERMQSLARAAADPHSATSELECLDREIEELQADLNEVFSNMHYRMYQAYDRTLDDCRLASRSNNYDDSVLIWERRPFEPLRIHEDEQYPRVPRSLVYFEADANPAAMHKIHGMPLEKRTELLELFDAVSFIFSTRDKATIGELVEAIFPRRSTNEIVESIPSLAPYAGKRLKPGCGALSLPDETLDPNECYQSNINYDLTNARLRCLPVTIMWDILLEYQRHALDLSVTQFSRLLGGTVTSFRNASHPTLERKLH